jgi:putative ABC transport system permease protein
VLLVARKNLFSERTRLAISVGGVALSVFLISLLLSLYRGWDEKVGGFVENSNVDVWAGALGTNDFLTANSVIPLEGTEALDAYQPVAQWSPVIVRPMTGVKVQITNQQETFGAKIDMHLIGYDTTTGIAGPIKVIDGKQKPGPDEVIVDKALSKRYDVGIGDMIQAGGKNWTVVGISEGGDFVASQTAFVTLEQAQQVLQMTGYATFIGMRTAAGVDPNQVVTDASSLAPDFAVFTKADFASATRDRALGDILPILIIILGLAFIVGLAVAGLTIYTATIEKGREYGILKAVGFKNRYLYRLVFEQALVTGAMGFAIGVGLTLLFGPLATDYVPQFVTLVRWQDLAGVFAATVLMSAIAGYVPVRRLASIDPVAAFKA